MSNDCGCIVWTQFDDDPRNSLDFIDDQPYWNNEYSRAKSMRKQLLLVTTRRRRRKEKIKTTFIYF